MPRVQFLPYEWELDGKRQPWSSWPCLPGIELLQCKFGGGAGGWCWMRNPVAYSSWVEPTPPDREMGEEGFLIFLPAS